MADVAADQLLDGECQIWWAHPGQVPDTVLMSVMTDAELHRAGRYRQRSDRLRSMTGGWLLRAAVAAQTGGTPREVVLDRTCPDCGQQHGRPRLPPELGLHVSLAHAGERIAVALTPLGEVGVDVEQVPVGGRFDRTLAEHTLTPTELTSVGTADEFMRLWVRKEALLKATGHGMGVAMDRIEVTPPDRPPALLSWPLERPVDQVRMAVLNPGPRHHAAVAVLTGSAMRVLELDAGLLL